MTGVRLPRPLARALGLLALAALFLQLLPAYARAQFTRFQSYNDEQGLSDLTVTALAQDSDGSMLLGTQGGLDRFDGQTITPYDSAVGLPPAAWIAQLTTDDAGRIWVVTTSGVFVRLGTTFKQVGTGKTFFDPAMTHSLASSGSVAFLVADGRLLEARVSAGTVGPFHPAVADATLAAFADLRRTRFVVADGQGGVLLGCGDAICRLGNGRVTELGRDYGLPADNWQVAVRTTDGTLWTRSLDHMAWLRPGRTSFKVVEIPGQRSSFFAGHPAELALVSDQHGGILTQSDQGVLRWDGTAWRSFPHHEGGLPPSVIEALTFDREGSLWAGSSGYGAFRSQGMGAWEHWTTQDGLPDNNVWSIMPSGSGRLWVATQSGTVSLPGPASVIGGSNYALAQTRQGRLWAAPMGEELVRVDEATGSVERFAPVGTVLRAAVDRANRLWLCTRSALFVIDDADAPAAAVHARFVLSQERMSIGTDAAGMVWMLSRGGVYREDEAGHFQPVVPPAALKGQPTAFSVAGNSELWIGTEENGIQRFRLSGGAALPLAPIGMPNISSDATLFLHRDHRGWMWVGTDHGIDVLDRQKWRHYDSSNGAISNDVDEWSVAEGGDGSMWFGTSHGLSHLIDPARQAPAVTLHPSVTQVMLGDRKLDVRHSINVAWSAAPLEIRFTDLDFDLGRVGFRYRMVGLDPGWSETTGREARYAHLPAGKLRFELVAFNANHDVTSAAVGFTLRINAPWWQRWWFYTLCCVLGALVMLASWKVRVRLLLQHKRQLEALVGARTAEIEDARRELQAKAIEEQERLAGEQRRLEEMVRVRTLEIEQARHELERLAMSDALTGLANRRAIMDRLVTAVAQAQAAETPLAVLLCDLDRFKAINDGFGHLAGDMVLREFGDRLGAAITDAETAGRYGGEEFLLILPAQPDETRARVAALRLRLTGTPFEFGGAERIVTLSGGLAFRRDGDTATSLVERADEALYRATRGGRDQVEEESAGALSCEGAPAVLGPPGRTGAEPRDRRSGDLEHELRVALTEGQFELHYQPVVDLREQAVTSCEALLRWSSPVLGPVSPGVFIPHAEQIGLMPALGIWVLGAACREAASWPENVRVSVNLSPLQLRRPDLKDRVAAALEASGLAPSRLELEVTETAMIDDVAGASSTLMALKQLGVTIALDDFGTGASSLSFLRTLPFDRLKIDKSFVHDLGVRPEAVAIVRAMTALCGSLGRGITGEGAETELQIAMLRDAGCTEVQGFGICRPAPPAELGSWLAGFGGRHGSRALAGRLPALVS